MPSAARPQSSKKGGPRARSNPPTCRQANGRARAEDEPEKTELCFRPSLQARGVAQLPGDVRLQATTQRLVGAGEFALLLVFWQESKLHQQQLYYLCAEAPVSKTKGVRRGPG